MKISRKEFVKIVSLAIGGLAINPYQSVITNENVYINKKLGIYFEIPKEWGFVHTKDFGKLKDKQIISDYFHENPEEILEDLGYPICIGTKYYQDLPQYKGVFSPTITLNVTHESELEDLEFENFEELMDISAFGTATILKDFEIIKRNEPYYLNDVRIYENDATYLFEHVELKNPVKVELKVIKFKNNGFYYDFNCHQSKESNEIAIKEFKYFKNSIKLI